MALTFQKLSRNSYLSGKNQRGGYLQPDNWDDFGHKTLFNLTVFDEQGNQVEIGNIKIGLIGQTEGWTEEHIPKRFDMLPEGFYSLGQDADYYRNIVERLSQEDAVNVLTSLRDVAYDTNSFQLAQNEGAFNSSLLRTVNITSIEHQFRRILRGEAPLTDYDFFYEKPANDRYSGVRVEFTVTPNVKPSSNIHILIGRNGVGKTTLLNNMVDALLPERGNVDDTGYFSNRVAWGGNTPLHEDYFAGLVSVSFSAFDPFDYPENRTTPNTGMRYHYVGLRKYEIQNGVRVKSLKSDSELNEDFVGSLRICFSLIAKRERWLNSVRKLESDLNFADMDLCELVNIYNEDQSELKRHFSEISSSLFSRMSSGHAIVLLTITKLVESVEEKTLLLLDEPESHLHPPLLSAFTRALSDLLVDRNGVAIIATHSPVVLQEVPKSCVSILRRTRLVANIDRPENETFAENVGVLTREVFGLEVSKSGFHDLLSASVDEGKSYEEIEQEYQYQLGFEGKAILRSLISIRDSQLGVRR